MKNIFENDPIVDDNQEHDMLFNIIANHVDNAISKYEGDDIDVDDSFLDKLADEIFYQIVGDDNNDIEEDAKDLITYYVKCYYNDYIDDDLDNENLSEASLNKHKITKIQSFIMKRKRKTDAKLKRSRRLTMLRKKARGGRVINRKLSKAVKKHYRMGFGKRWESENLNIKDMKMDLQELINRFSALSEERVESVKDSLTENFSKAEIFGTLNEDESKNLSEFAINEIITTAKQMAESIAVELIEETEKYIAEEVVEHYNDLVESYVDDVVVPEYESKINGYLDYVAEQVVTDLDDKKLVVEGRMATQYREFAMKVKDLFEQELQIIPEQEDMVEVLEQRIEILESNNKELSSNVVRANRKINETELLLWAINQIPNGVSVAKRDSLMEAIEEINTADAKVFKLKVNRLMEEEVGDEKQDDKKQKDNEDKKDDKKDEKVDESTIFNMSKYLDAALRI